MKHDKYAIYIVLIVAIVGLVSLISIVTAPSAEDLTGQFYSGGAKAFNVGTLKTGGSYTFLDDQQDCRDLATEVLLEELKEGKSSADAIEASDEAYCECMEEKGHEDSNECFEA